jgi:hypothetical protein
MDYALFLVLLLSWNKKMFLSKFILVKYFDWTLTRQIKANQSWMIKSVLIPEKKTWGSLKYQDVTEQILSSHHKIEPHII